MDRLDVLDARMEARRVRLIAEFAAMEESLAMLQSQSVALLSMWIGRQWCWPVLLSDSYRMIQKHPG